MNVRVVSPKQNIKGLFPMPGDKSISHRAVMLGAIADGVTEIDGFLPGEDCISTIKCFRDLGISITQEGTRVCVEGNGKNGLRKSDGVLDVGNSGTTLRLMTGLLSGQAFDSDLTGDASIQKRPMDRVFVPLTAMGAAFSPTHTAPFTIYGRPLTGTVYKMPVASAQVKSAILLAGLYAKGETIIEEEKPTRDHTEIMLNRFQGKIDRKDGQIISRPVSKLEAQKIIVPGDISSAAFFLVAGAVVPGAFLTVTGVGVNPTRTGLLDALRNMGAKWETRNYSDCGSDCCGEPTADISIRFSTLKPITLSGGIIARMIDEIPVFAVAALFARGRTIVKNAAELKVKESNRIQTVTQELSKMGAHLTETDDGIIIDGGYPLHGAVVNSHGDHRIAMSLAVAALAADGETVIENADCTDISFPGFFEKWSRL